MGRISLRRLRQLALLGSMVCASAVQAQVGDQSIRIKVTGTDGLPIEAAEIQIATSEGRPVSILSDAEGNAIIDPARIDGAGGADITITAIGYQDAYLSVVPDAEPDIVVQLNIARDDGGIVVVGRRVSRPFSPHTLGLLDIVTDARASADPILAANNLPSSTNVAANATLSLRATRPSISRLYLNDIPVFEFARGGSVDSATQAGSIFNLGNTKDVEVYPGNPPLYLAGSSGGALRALPPTAATAGGNLALNTAAVGLSGTLTPGKGASFLSLSALYSDLQPQLSINPDLSDLVSRLRLRSASLVGHAPLGASSEVSLFGQAETEDGHYPVEVFGFRENFRQDADRYRVLSSFSTGIGASSLTLNGSYTETLTQQDYAGWSSLSANRYSFYSLDFASEAFGSRLTYRIGIDSDLVSQESSQSFGDAIIPIAGDAPPRSDNRNNDVAAYAFASYRIGPAFLMSLGARRILFSDLNSEHGIQMSGTMSSTDKRHKLIVSLGRYFGAEVPQYAYYGGLARSVSRQIEANYSFTVPGLRLGLSLYRSEETSDRSRSALEEGRFYVFDDGLTGLGRRTETTGIEAYLSASPVDRLETKLSLSSIDQKLDIDGVSYRGSSDFDYIVRGALKYDFNGFAVNLAATARQGAPFTRITSIFGDEDGSGTPVTAPINSERLPAYFSLDMSLATPIALSADVKPLAFLSLANILDRRNVSSQILGENGTPIRYRSYPGRVLTFGISLNF